MWDSNLNCEPLPIFQLRLTAYNNRYQHWKLSYIDMSIIVNLISWVHLRILTAYRWVNPYVATSTFFRLGVITYNLSHRTDCQEGWNSSLVGSHSGVCEICSLMNFLRLKWADSERACPTLPHSDLIARHSRFHHFLFMPVERNNSTHINALPAFIVLYLKALIYFLIILCVFLNYF